MDFITIIGLIAATLTTIQLFPQVVRVLRTKCCKDISVGMFAIMCSSVTLWVAYGVFLNNIPIIASNSLVFVQAAIILAYKTKFRVPPSVESTDVGGSNVPFIRRVDSNTVLTFET